MLKKMFVFSLLVVFISLNAFPAAAQSKYFGNWAPGTSPQEIGKRLAENWVKRDFEFQSGKRQYLIYPEVCTWYGALTIADETNDKDLKERLARKFDRFTTADGAKNISPQAHVDYRVIGVVPLEIYMQSKDDKYLTFGQSFADKQWEKTTDDGITAEARYWIDDMYMITAVQVQAYRATGNKTYLDRAAKTMAAYLDKLQQPNGLFFHAPDSQYYWGRGNGWQAAGMAELLRDLPKNHPQRARILKGYKLMMESLLKYQAEDGLWRQLVDVPESWTETSGTGMFTFAIVTGVKEGWLDKKTYGPAARKAWLGLVKHIDENANVTDVCVGTNKGFSVQYYLDRERKTGDLHGQAAATWAATALLR
ncbi:MAG TPA: glycoside hydrolase family 88 protein [Pyrinomonadaceae bacterium]|jgi:rhamnogalacturonyl hydrolase YesR